MTILQELEEKAHDNGSIPKELYAQHDIKRGLRNSDSSGVLVGLTSIGEVVGYQKVDGKVIPVDGRLFYRGIEIQDLVKGFQLDKRAGFEEIIYLLLSGELPNKTELNSFANYLGEERELPGFVRNVLIRLASKDIMNLAASSVLALYSADDNAEDLSLSNLLRQSVSLIAKLPVVIAYAYLNRFSDSQEIELRYPQVKMSTAENFLYMLKGEDYSQLEVEILDLCLVLQAEHGGGNNSAFTSRVLSSVQTDTYSAIAAALGSLKGRLHGGANLKVMCMMEEAKEQIKDWNNEDHISNYLLKILQKEAYDRSGVIYGIGHAMYTLSDPRAILLKEKAELLAKEKGRSKEFKLYSEIERLAPDVLRNFKKGKAKEVCANVDYYSGFVYDCLQLPSEIYTALFAASICVGWCAHRIEELSSGNSRIIRPSYKNVNSHKAYLKMGER